MDAESRNLAPMATSSVVPHQLRVRSWAMPLCSARFFAVLLTRLHLLTVFPLDVPKTQTPVSFPDTSHKLT